MKKLLSLNHHQIINGYLNLDPKTLHEISVNPVHIVSIDWKPNYTNGYGERLECLVLKTVKDNYTFYREDAKAAYERLKPYILRKEEKENGKN